MREAGWIVCVVAAVVVAVGGSASERSAAVFQDMQPPSNAVVAAEHVTRQRFADVDLEQFGEIHGRVRQGGAARVALNLWDDAEFDALINRTERTSAGYSLSGPLVGVRHGAATLVVNADVVVGTVWTPQGLYDIRTVNGLQVLREVDLAALPPLAPPMVRSLPSGRGGVGATVQPQYPDDGSVVDVLVLWTAGAVKKAGSVANIRALIDLGVAAANDAYARGGVRFRLSLVGAEQTDFPDIDLDEFDLPFGLSEAEIAAWEEELDAQWDDVFAVRDRVGADVISIVMKMGFGGFGNLMHELSPEFESLAHNFVHVDRIAYNTLAHEIGHNMGLHHDRFVNPEGGVFPYSHGYVNQRALDPGAARDTCWGTIMAYLSQCGSGGHRLGMRIPYFSNPHQRYPEPNGDPLGVDESSTFVDARGPANAVASLNKVRHVVANFRRSLGDRGGATDHGDTPNEATSVLVQSLTHGLLVGEDVDYFRIDVPRTGTLRIETTGATDTRGELTSAERNGDFRGVRDDNGGQDSNFLIEHQVKAGAYFVAVRGAADAQGPYRLQVSLDWLRHDDHGDSAQQATPVAAPSSTDGVLGPNDVDYFRVVLPEAATLRVESSGSVDTHGTLAWPDGRAMLEDDDGGRNQNFRIETALPAGAYMVAVRGFSARASTSGRSYPATGFYTLNIWFGPDGQDDDHGDAWATATTVPVPSATTGALETALDVDVFRIELPALGTLRVQTTGNTDTRGRLFRESDGDYDEVLGNDDGGAGGNFLVEETLASGIYLVEVRGFRGATTGGYTLEATFAPGADDHGDTQEEATAIALPSSTEGQVDAMFDADYFRVTLPEAGTLVVDISGGFFPFARLTDERAVNLGISSPISSKRVEAEKKRVEAEKLPAGVYFIAVRTDNWDLAQVPFLGGPTYTLDVSFTPSAPPDDHGDRYTLATAVSAPSTTAGELDESGDVDYFRFPVTPGILRVWTTGTTNTHGRLSCSGDVREDDDGGQNGNFAIEMAVSAGHCYMRVRGGDDAAIGSYVLEITLGPLPSDDHGDTPSAASLVGPRSTTNATLHRAGDADVFRIDLPEAGVLRLETTGDTDTVAQLASEAGVLLAEDDSGGALLNARIDQWVGAGTYFITITGWGGATGDYTLRLTFASTTTLPNNHAVPLVLSAREAPRRQSLVRIVNRSATGGTVSIRAVDDSGALRGPVALALEAGHAAHFDSHDLETGNPAKGLPAGVGPGNGDWRLLLGTALDVEPLAYVYTQDGFLASMHDVVPATGLRHRVPVFNPAGNRQQASQLRLINANAEAAEVTISAVDDTGAAAPGGTVALTIPSGEARAVSAEQLEAGGEALRGSLGDGAGKWRLSVAASRPVVVMSLQTSPDGGMTNISTRPLAATDHALPLLLAGHRHPLQGFVRVVNTSDTAGEVAIHATGDAGRRYGPLALALGARRAAHFNSADLEQGNLDKGLSGGGTGGGEGDWRLDFSSQLAIEVLAYARGPVGPLATMHDVAPSLGQTHRVPIFNPASERDQVSELRLVNPGAQDADISIAATDDLGQPAPAGGVSLTLGARESRTVTAQQLEEGAPNLAGSLGDGDGRWRLMVSASAPVQVMNLLRGTDGRLSNLSTAPVSPSE